MQDVIESCEQIVLFAQGVSDAELIDDSRPLRGAVLHNLMILGEAAKHVPAVWQGRYSAIPWKRIAGMRDKIVHYYFGIDDDVVIATTRTSVPAILPQLRSMLSEMDRERIGE